jgi:hypothetical protein
MYMEDVMFGGYESEVDNFGLRLFVHFDGLLLAEIQLAAALQNVSQQM